MNRKFVALAALWITSGLAGAAVRWYIPASVNTVFARDPKIPEWVRQAVVDDPKVGAQCGSMVARDLEGRPVVLPFAGKTTVVLCLWRCNSCGFDNSVRALVELASHHPDVKAVALVIRAERAGVKALLPSIRLPVSVLVDQDAGAARKLNAVFQSRMYVIDKRGYLRLVSPYGLDRAHLFAVVEDALRKL